MVAYQVKDSEVPIEWDSQLEGNFVGVRLRNQGLFIVEFQDQKTKTIFPILISKNNIQLIMAFYRSKQKFCSIMVRNYHYNHSTRYKLLWINE